MAINIACPCGKTYSLDDSMAGRKARCGRCQALIDVPVFVPSLNIQLEDVPIRAKIARRSTSPHRWIGGVFACYAAICYASVVLREVDKSWEPTILAVCHPLIAAAVILGTPVVVPVVLARRGVLSVAQWLIFALIAFLAAVFSFVGLLLMFTRGTAGGSNMIAVLIVGELLASSVTGTLGCLLAGGLHKKTATQ